jgi:hypothetical protein
MRLDMCFVPRNSCRWPSPDPYPETNETDNLSLSKNLPITILGWIMQGSSRGRAARLE